jgi:hypothetical protein
VQQKPTVTLTEKPRDVFMELPYESAENNYTLKEPHKIVHQLNENMKKAVAKLVQSKLTDFFQCNL